ncbi:lytic murein transglycosylase [Candidatus Woesearchaeota archaeon]|nr:lytic murein transglycosylase [Candidatus Woesearchaeota archaeon]
MSNMNRREFSKLLGFSAPHFLTGGAALSQEKSLEKRVNEVKQWLKQNPRVKYSAEKIDELFDDERFELFRNIEKYRGSTKNFRENPETKAKSGKISYAAYRVMAWLTDHFNTEGRTLSGNLRLAPGKFERFGKALLDAEKRHGVDARVINGLLGIESGWGNNLGKYNAFCMLVYNSISNDNEFAEKYRKQFIEYLSFCKNNNHHPLRFKSSRACCIGAGQFSPEDLNEYFCGKDGDSGDANPEDIEDAIYSIGYFLSHANGTRPWIKEQTDELIAELDSKKDDNGVWNFTDVDGRALRKKYSNWANVYRYNHSNYFVAAVFELAKESRKLTPVLEVTPPRMRKYELPSLDTLSTQ